MEKVEFDLDLEGWVAFEQQKREMNQRFVVGIEHGIWGSSQRKQFAQFRQLGRNCRQNWILGCTSWRTLNHQIISSRELYNENDFTFFSDQYIESIEKVNGITRETCYMIVAVIQLQYCEYQKGHEDGGGETFIKKRDMRKREPTDLLAD